MRVWSNMEDRGTNHDSFMDSDWGADVVNCHSVSRYLFSLGCGAISWSLKKQAAVATSSMEAEYMASCHAIKEAMWLCSFLKLIGFEQKKATLIHCDNNSSNSLCKDPTFHKRTKHIDIQYHYIQERVNANDISFTHIPGGKNLVGALTKLLQHPHFEFLHSRLGIHLPIHD